MSVTKTTGNCSRCLAPLVDHAEMHGQIQRGVFGTVFICPDTFGRAPDETLFGEVGE
ncbi:hypothetical protein ACFFQF_00815 [Haladaptatus pallidirubidus]|uniref:Uncharacterized protein n=1 Tax=Haladaptatus pallidirubidus TaxID=1008152 RepID=A0AAV3UBT7_9EURY|nr:hypothetical protein [Haladaptatus pallidirubidus]